MNIKFLKAGNGDCIIIHNNNKNILIDGGNDSKYLREEINNIHINGEKIDLLVITHHDDDHIKGIIDILEEVQNGTYGNKSEFIKQVIFNSPRLFLNKIVPNEEKLLSYKQAHRVEELLISIDQKNWKITTNESDPIIFDDLKLEILSPISEDVDKYSNNTGAYLSTDYKSDWCSSMRSLDSHINDDSQDKSLFNKNSVVLKIECNDKKILLTGDVTPARLEKIISDLVINNNGEPVEFDYIKMPHHGSYRSINKKIIENLKCFNYIISTNSKKYSLPNKRALLKILKYSNRSNIEKINFIFNYEEALQNLNITPKELKDYNFTLTKNNFPNGFSI